MVNGEKLARWLRERGPAWTLLWSLRRALVRGQAWLLRALDPWLAEIERQRFIVGADTVSSARNTMSENRSLWNDWDWSQLGEEWTEHASDFRGLDPEAWKQDVLQRFLHAHAPKEGVFLEIGPGAGRWTEHLLGLASRLYLADISPRCLDLCRDRFGDDAALSCHLVETGRLPFLADASIDFVWSYDVFVHVNPLDTDTYLGELARVLRPGGRAVLHHADRYTSRAERRAGFRSNLSRAFVSELCRRRGLRVLEQDLEHAHKSGDCITVLERPAS